ncbi:MAG: lysostaphin resistance A-like protein [Ruminococcus sp.]
MDTYSWTTSEASQPEPQAPPSAPQPQIDPQNPFENSLENAEYRMDYRRVLPQILLPGFEIPLFPEREERRAIRKSMNTAGLLAFLGSFLSQTLFLVLIMVILIIMNGSARDCFSGGAADAIAYLQNSSILISSTAIVFSALNVTIALVGCRSVRIPMRSLFQTRDFTPGKAMQYMVIGVGLQCVTGITCFILDWFLSQNGMEMAEADFSYFSSVKSTMAVALYTCILAPVTEELLFRGFLMKTLSKVSIRFGIVMSALLFGLIHGNVYQFLLGFLVGMFMGKIDVRHNSLLPSILVHAAVNTMTFMLSLGEELLAEEIGLSIFNFLATVYFSIALVGIIFWFLKERKQALPYPTQKQATRIRVSWTSPCLLGAIVLELGVLILNEIAA